MTHEEEIELIKSMGFYMKYEPGVDSMYFNGCVCVRFDGDRVDVLVESDDDEDCGCGDNVLEAIEHTMQHNKLIYQRKQNQLKSLKKAWIAAQEGRNQ
jgi:hypothetical protein